MRSTGIELTHFAHPDRTNQALSRWPSIAGERVNELYGLPRDRRDAATNPAIRPYTTYDKKFITIRPPPPGVPLVILRTHGNSPLHRRSTVGRDSEGKLSKRGIFARVLTICLGS